LVRPLLIIIVLLLLVVIAHIVGGIEAGGTDNSEGGRIKAHAAGSINQSLNQSSRYFFGIIAFLAERFYYLFGIWS